MQERQLHLQQQQEKLARQQKQQNEELKRQNSDLARQLRDAQGQNGQSGPSYGWLPKPPVGNWVTDKYLKSYTNSWYYVCQNYPLLGSDNYVRRVFDAELANARKDPKWALTTIDYGWLRRFSEAFASRWGVPKATDLRPDTPKFREYALKGTPKMRTSKKP